MKNGLITLVLIALISLVSQGQTLTVSMPTVTATPGQVVYIPVKLSGASSAGIPISGANIQVSYDTAVLHYDTLTNFYTAMPQNQWFFSGHDGLVSANWLEPSLNTLAIPNNTALYEIKFTYKGGNSPLTFLVTEFTDSQYNIVSTTPVNGAVNAPVVYRQVTFQVDMSKVNISTSGVHLAGSFNNWNYLSVPMTLIPATSTYAATVNVQENGLVQYRFVNGDNITGLETVPASCGVINGFGQFDRQILVPNQDTVYTAVCFGMCSHCPASVTVTFRVDMQNETVSSNGVHLAGNFNGWNYAQNLMINTGGTVYEAPVTLEEGSPMEFRYVNGISSLNAETVPPACALNGNRYGTVPAYDTVLNSYCFGSCTVCGAQAHYSHVTFRVDLRTQDSISSDGVHIAATFQGWNPSTTPMVSIGDSVYTYTDSLLTGASIQYRFVNGSSVSGLETVPFVCSLNDNRTLLVPDNDTVLQTVCFSSCDSCILTGVEGPVDREPINLRLFPNPMADVLQISLHVPVEGNLTLTVVNSIGQGVGVVFQGMCSPGETRFVFHRNPLPSGIYSLNVRFDNLHKSYLKNKTFIIE